MQNPPSLRLSEAQQLYEAIQDPLLRPALEAFFEFKAETHSESLLRAVLAPVRDTMKEARLAGMVQANQDAFADLEAFAKKQMQEAGQ